MSKIYAVVKGGVVSNLVVWDGNEETWKAPSDSECVPVPDGIAANIGDTYGADGFVAAEPAVAN